MPGLTLYNSLTRSLEAFEPLDQARGVRVYSCGPTVYNYAHLGNLRAYVFTDTLSRTLTWKGYPLTHIINITDVGHLTSDADAGDDKMEAAARAQARSIWEIAAHYTDAFKANIRDLNIREPSRWSVATDHIAEMIDFAKQIAIDHCYELDTGLYFDTSTVADYGRLAGAQDDAAEGRIDPVAGKRHPQDFAIWRKSPPGEQRQMEWDSPWGMGAPGWHLECSVMSLKYLGAPFDIHTGGIDHREIHHPNEIAQNQAFCGCSDSGAHFWMHNNFLVDRSGKMSKSKGGFTTLQSLIDAGVHPLAYRLLCLQAHYRSELEFSTENLAAALVRLKRMIKVVDVQLWREYEATGDAVNHPSRYLPIPREKWAEADVAGVLTDFEAAISQDLNTPRCLPLLEEVLVDPTIDNTKRWHLIATIDEVLGLNLLSTRRSDLRIRPASATVCAEDIEARLVERKEARAGKDFARSDAIRDELAAAGVEVMDGDPLGWDWKPAL
ncbi:cysteine--tRNA ligase [Sphingomonas sp.]|jgi:cysteinyl-tRNA synthetase|uniref:cysteine--tRNA ligase n=1 Tax=Sphingomonas sp. TaxID=28214 RepID=UPI002ED9E433